MWVILKTFRGEIGRVVWPTVPAVDQLIKFKNNRYRVLGVVHDMDTSRDIILVLEGI